MIGVTVLGATGSIGVSTLDVLAHHRERYRVVALAAHTEVDRLVEQCRVHHPRYAVMADAGAAERLRAHLREIDSDIEVLAGVEGLVHVAAHPDADYVMAGGRFMDEVRAHGATGLPVDSEHNAIFQCLPAGCGADLPALGVRQILLTASGGPFRTMPLAELEYVTPAQACAHPNWEMGRKISVDSATMMNKGLEVIEACWLFNVGAAQVQVVIHPQSVIHSMVEYVDGSLLAQLGSPDMRTPIAHALAWPARIEAGVRRLDLLEVATLQFSRPDLARFPCLRLAYEAYARGGTATTRATRCRWN